MILLKSSGRKYSIESRLVCWICASLFILTAFFFSRSFSQSRCGQNHVKNISHTHAVRSFFFFFCNVNKYEPMYTQMNTQCVRCVLCTVCKRQSLFSHLLYFISYRRKRMTLLLILNSSPVCLVIYILFDKHRMCVTSNFRSGKKKNKFVRTFLVWKSTQNKSCDDHISSRSIPSQKQ